MGPRALCRAGGACWLCVPADPGACREAAPGRGGAEPDDNSS